MNVLRRTWAFSPDNTVCVEYDDECGACRVRKSDAGIDTLKGLRNNLMVKPKVNEVFGNDNTTIPFPLYLESEKFLYVPPYLPGLQFPPRTKNSAQNTLLSDVKPDAQNTIQSSPFDCSIMLRANQMELAANVRKTLLNERGCLLNVPCGFGKCLAKDTPVMMFDGSTKSSQCIKIGDHLMGDDSTPRIVSSTCSGVESLYRVKSADGTFYDVNRSHVLSLFDERHEKVVDICIEDYLKLSSIQRGSLKGYRVPVHFISNYFATKEELDFEVHRIIINNYIPDCLKRSHISYRLIILSFLIRRFIIGVDETRGITIEMPDAGSIHKDFIFVARSVGLVVKKDKYNRISISGDVLNLCNVLDCIEFKHVKNVVDIEVSLLCESGRYFGFELIGNNRRFLLEDCTVTHNTVMSVWAMSQLKVKTLVIVHKTFLMDQFAQTLACWMPNAKIGTIQGQKCDYADKDVVLGMIQTLCSDSFRVSPILRKYFGFVVVDECHHIAAKVFSRAMLRFPSIYTLGLSATPHRKDGLGYVVNYFIGNTVISSLSKNDAATIKPSVISRYFVHPTHCTCDGYGMERTRYVTSAKRRVPLLTSMITDIVQCNCRNIVVVEEICKYMSSDRNILVVSDRKNHLESILAQLELLSNPLIKAGLYVGGMKAVERDRVATECNVILGTYAMTREGLDIGKLNTLIMATPTSDIVQVVGRVTRRPSVTPLIIDIIDTYSVFQNQAKKRRITYRKMGFSDDETDDGDDDDSNQALTSYMFCERKAL